MGQAIFSKLKPPLTGKTHNYAQECSNNMVDLFSYVQKQQQQKKAQKRQWSRIQKGENIWVWQQGTGIEGHKTQA